MTNRNNSYPDTLDALDNKDAKARGLALIHIERLALAAKVEGGKIAPEPVLQLIGEVMPSKRKRTVKAYHRRKATA